MKYEVKGFKGRFVPFGGKEADPNKTVFENAVEYVENPAHAERYAFAAIVRGSKAHAGMMKVVIYNRTQVLDAIKAFSANRASAPVLGIHNGAIAVMRLEYMTMRQTFGRPLEEYETELTKWKDLQPDTGNAPYARAWEKVCAKACGGKWVGGLNRVQIDFIVNEADE